MNTTKEATQNMPQENHHVTESPDGRSSTYHFGGQPLTEDETLDRDVSRALKLCDGDQTKAAVLLLRWLEQDSSTYEPIIQRLLADYIAAQVELKTKKSRRALGARGNV